MSSFLGVPIKCILSIVSVFKSLSDGARVDSGSRRPPRAAGMQALVPFMKAVYINIMLL